MLTYINGDFVFWGRNFQPLYEGGLVIIIGGVLAMWLGYHLPLGGALGKRIPVGPNLGSSYKDAISRYGRILTISALILFLLWIILTGTPVAQFLLPGIISSTDYSGVLGGKIPYLFLTIEWFYLVFPVVIGMYLIRPRGFQTASAVEAQGPIRA